MSDSAASSDDPRSAMRLASDSAYVVRGSRNQNSPDGIYMRSVPRPEDRHQGSARMLQYLKLRAGGHRRILQGALHGDPQQIFRFWPSGRRASATTDSQVSCAVATTGKSERSAFDLQRPLGKNLFELSGVEALSLGFLW